MNLLEYFRGDELAANVWLNKYAGEGEQTPDDMHKRMALPLSQEMQKFDPIYSEPFVYRLLSKFATIIPQGSIMAALGLGKIVSLSNCFVVDSPKDSYAGVCHTDAQLPALMKRRGGVGLSLNNLRPRGSKVSNAARSSTGVALFAERYSNTTREVAQDGRRGALMLSLSVKHPDASDFINMKSDLTKVTGANVSLEIEDDFMQAVIKDEHFLQTWPCDMPLTESDYNVIGQKMMAENLDTGELIQFSDSPLRYARIVKASDLYDEVIRNAWANAEPGQMFMTRMWEHSPDGVYPQYRTLTTNPCCFAESCRVDVVTKSGIKDLREVTSEDEVWLDGEGKFVPTSGYFRVGVHPVYKVTFSNGESLVITNNHKLAKVDPKRSGTKVDKLGFGLVELKDLSVDDEIRIHLQPSSSFGDLGTYEDGLILGWLSGDGCLSYKNEGDNFPTMYLDFWPSDVGADKIVEEAVRSIGLTNEVLSFKNNGNNVQRIHSTRLTEYYTEKFESNIWNWRKGRNPILYKMTRDFVKGYLSSYFTADGTIHTSYESSNFNIQLTSIVRPRLEQVQMLLTQFGIKSSIGVSKEAGTYQGVAEGYKTKETYRLTITGVEHLMKFHTEIGFISEAKSAKLEALSEHNHRYTKSSTCTKIKSIELVGEEMVGCIEVPGYNYFTANTIISGNSEIGMGPNDACRLVAYNLMSAVKWLGQPWKSSAVLDLQTVEDEFYHLQVMADAIVALEIKQIDKILAKIMSDPEPIEIKRPELELWGKIRDTAEASRRTGSGYTALGDVFAALEITYGSQESLDLTKDIHKAMLRGCLSASIDLAKRFGPFKGWDPTIEDNSYFTMLKEEFPDLWEQMQISGRRNVSWSTVAPTGTTSLMAQCTSGIEPIFMGFYKRRKKINPTDPASRVDFKDQNGDCWMEFPVIHPPLKIWLEARDFDTSDPQAVENGFKLSPWYGSEANNINWEQRVALQGIAQRYISHSISSTINLPNSATQEDVKTIYLQAWNMGLKGVTVYRDGCRTGVLVSSTDQSTSGSHFKRPHSLPGTLFHVTALGRRWTIIVGLRDGSPIEVFASTVVFGTHKSDVDVVRAKKRHYRVMQGDIVLIENVVETNTGEEAALAKMISGALRHGMGVEYVEKILSENEGAIVSFSKAMARTLRRFITKKLSCSECGGTNVVFEEGCSKCLECGYSKCS